MHDFTILCIIVFLYNNQIFISTIFNECLTTPPNSRLIVFSISVLQFPQETSRSFPTKTIVIHKKSTISEDNFNQNFVYFKKMTSKSIRTIIS